MKQSSAGPAKAIYAEIERQISEGRTDESIRGYLVSRFGTEQLLRPEATGVSSIVWIAPVVVAVLALAALVVAFRRWRPNSVSVASPEDEALVAALRAGTLQAGTLRNGTLQAGTLRAGESSPNQSLAHNTSNSLGGDSSADQSLAPKASNSFGADS